MGIRWRLAAWYGGVFALALALLILINYAVYAEEQYRSVDRQMRRSAAVLVGDWDRRGPLEPHSVYSEVLIVTRRYDKAGRLAAATHPQLELPQSSPASLLAGGERQGLGAWVGRLTRPPVQIPPGAGYTTLTVAGERWRAYLQPLGGPQGGYLELLSPLGRLDASLAAVGRSLILGGLSALALMLLVGWGLASRALLPVARLTQAARQIAGGSDLGRRVAVAHPRDELGQLAQTFNRMLDGLEGQHKRLEEVVRFERSAKEQLESALRAERDAKAQLDAAVHSERNAKALLEAVLTNLPVGLAVFDRELRYVQANPEIARMNGLAVEEHLGRRLEEVLPSAGPRLRPRLEGVLASGEGTYNAEVSGPSPLYGGQRGHALVSWFPIQQGEETGLVGAAVLDITERKRAEEALRQSEERQGFLLRLADALRPLHDPARIHEAVSRIALEFFGCDRCYYCEIEGGQALIRGEAAKGDLPPVAGEYPLEGFPLFRAVLEAGRPFAVDDAHRSELLDEELRRLCLELRVISFLDVPVVKEGRPVGLLCLTQAEPREWTGVEVELAEEVAERVWAAVERSRAEAALREGEARLALALESGRMGAWDWDLASGMQVWSPQMSEIFGMEHRELRPTAEFYRVVHPDDLADIRARADRAAAEGRDFVEDEFRVLRPDGRLVWISSRARLHRDAQGRVARMTGVNMDITERKQAQEALRHSEEFSRTVLEASPDCVKVLDLEGRLVSMNFNGLCLMEIDDFSAFAGRAWATLWPEDWRDTVQAAVEAAKAGRSFRFQAPAPTAKGTPKHWDVIVTPVPGEAGRPTRLLSVSRDVSEQKRSEEALRHSEAEFRLLAEALPQFVWAVEPDGRVSYVNERWAAFSGLDLRDTRDADDLTARYHPDEQAAVRAAWEGAFQSLRPLEVEARMRRPDGGYGWYLVRGEPLLDDSGRPLRWFVTSTDITGLKVGEERLAERERFVNSLVQTAPAVIYVMDWVKGRNTYVSSQGAALLGYDPEEWLGLWENPQNLMHPDDWPRVLAHVEALGQADQGETRETEYRMRHRSGEWRWFSGRDAVYARTPEGGVQAILGVANDITERKRAEEALRDSERRLELGTRVAGLGLAEIDYLERTFTLSPEAARMYGLGDGSAPLRVENAAVHATFHPDDRAEVLAHIARSLEPAGGGWFEHDYRVVHPGGAVRWLRVRKQVYFDRQADPPRPLRATLAALDITERRQDEERLRQSEARLELGVRVAGLGLAELDYLSNTANLSPHAARLYGLGDGSAPLTVGRSALRATVHPEDRGTYELLLERALDPASEGWLEHDHRVVWPDGAVRWLRVRKQVYFDRQADPPRPLRATLAALDITQAKRGELQAALLAEVSEAATRQTASAEILRAVGGRIARHFGASRVILTEVNTEADRAEVLHEWRTEGLASLEGVFPLEDYVSPATLARLTADRPSALADRRGHPVPGGAERLAELGVGSVAHAPYLSGGRLRFLLVVALPAPHPWDADELALLHELAQRVWLRLEHLRAVEALRRSEEELRHTVELNPQVPWTADAGGNILDFNRRWLELTGLSREEALGAGWFKAPHPDDLPRIQAAWTAALGGGVPYDVEHRIRLADGSYRWMHTRAYPRRDEAGRVERWYGTTEDIEERRRAEAAVQQSERRYRSLVEASAQVVWRADPQGRLEEPERRWAALSGLPEADLPADLLELVHPDDRERGDTLWNQAVGSGAPSFSFEQRVRQAGGGYRHWQVRAAPVLGPDGAVSEWIGTDADITERKEAEERMRRSEAELRDILDNLPAVAYLKNPDGRLTFANRAFEELFGRTAEQVVGLTERDLFPTEAESIRANDLAVLASPAPLAFEETVPHADGVPHQYLSTKFALRRPDGQPYGLVGISLDITERKATEAALARTTAELESTLANLPLGLALMDRDLRFLRINSAMAALNGLAPEAHLGRSMSELALAHAMPPEPAQRIEAVMRRVLQTGQGVYEQEVSGPRVGDPGRPGHALASWFPVEVEGQTALVGSVVLDITERKEAEIRAAFQARAQAALAAQDGPEGIARAAGELLLERLAVSHCVFVEVGEDASTLTLFHEARRDGPPRLLGTYRLEDFHTPEERALLSSGQPVVVKDTAGLEPETAGRYAALGVGALLTVPFISRGRWRLVLSAQHDQPRAWTPEEVAAVREVAELFYPRLERARAEEALRQSEERYRTLFESIDQGFCVLEMIYDPSGAACDYRFLEVNPTFERQTGLENAAGRTALELVPGLERGWVERYASVAETGQPVRFERGSGVMGRWFEGYAMRVGEPAQRRVALLFSDITERRRYEEELRQSRNLLRLTLDNLLAFVGLLEPDGTVIEANRTALEAAGLRPEEVLGRPFWETYWWSHDPQTQARLRDAVGRAGAGEAVRYDVEVRARGEERITIDFTIAPIRDGAGRVVYLVPSAVDITERKRAEADLMQVNRDLQTILDTVPVGIAIGTDPGLLEVQANPAGAAMLGLGSHQNASKSRPDADQLPFRVLKGGVEVPPEELPMQVAASSGRSLRDLEYQVVHADGTTLDLLEYATPLWDAQNRVRGSVGVFVDITERKRAESERERLLEAVETERLLLDTLLTAAPAGFALLDPELRFVRVNRALAEINGLGVEAHLGRSLEEVVPDLAPTVRPLFERVLQTGEPLLNWELSGETAGAPGVRRDWLENVYRVTRSDGAVLGVGVVLIEVTERKRAEELVRQSERRFQVALGGSPIMVYECDLELRYTWVYNPLAGFGAEQVLGRRDDELMPEGVAGELTALKRGVLEGGHGSRAVVALPMPGGPAHYDLSAEPLRDAEGTISGLVVSVYDITPIKQAEAALRASELRFRAVQETTPDGFMVFESVRHRGRIVDFRWVYANPAAEAMVGRSAQELIGRRLLEEMPGNREEGLFDAYREVVETGRVWQREFHYNHEGIDLWFRSTAAKTGDGFAVSFADVTKTKQAEMALRDSEQRFRWLAEATPQMVWVFDAANRLTYVNGRFAEYSGLTLEQAASGEVNIIHPDDLAAFVAAGERALDSQGLFQVEVRIRQAATGEYRWFLHSAIPLHEDGRLVGWYGTSTDIHDRRIAEEAVRESERRLSDLVETQKRFVADASHELRAPLTSIQGNLELLQRFKNMSREDREAAISESAREAARLGRLVSDLLALARGDAGMRLQLEPTDLRAVLREALSELSPLARDKRLLAEELPEVLVAANRDRLKQVAIILLENALKYTPPGGTVRLEVVPSASSVELRVSDDGIGIAPEDLSRVFERFYRADLSRSKAAGFDGLDPGGTGLGLPIARWIVEQHGGEVWLESELGRGTVATVRLPKLLELRLVDED